MSEFIPLCGVAEIPERRGQAFKVGGKWRISVWKVGQRYVAFQDDCPHMGASLSDGRIEDNRVICWWHGWTFDIDSGQGDARPWACLRVYECKVEDGQVWIRLPDPEPEPEPEPEEDWIEGDPNRFFKRRDG